MELLERIGVRRYKIPSGEVTNLPLLGEVAQTGKPVILSSGMSSWEELDRAVDAFLGRGTNLTVLQCSSMYPCTYESVGLNVLALMKERWGVPVGFSDHTETNYAAFTAVALGAVTIEKHFTLSHDLYGSDARNSAEPDQFRDLVLGVRAIETMLQSQVDKSDLTRYEEMRSIFQKSIVALVDIPADTVLTREMLGIKKPGTGMPSHQIDKVLGGRARRTIPSDTVLTEADIIF